MAIEETPTDNDVFVAYDFGSRGRRPRFIDGRHVKISCKEADRWRAARS